MWSQSDALEPIYPESIFVPLPKGIMLFGRGTSLLGATEKSLLRFGRLGEATGKLNYYTKLAFDMGIQGVTKRTEAGFLVQLNHNIPRLLKGKNWATLYSKSLSTILGRQWQNQAIGLGLTHFGASGFEVFNLFNSIHEK